MTERVAVKNEDVELRSAIVQACLDWAKDTDDCHLCRRNGDGSHDEECLVGAYLARAGAGRSKA